MRRSPQRCAGRRWPTGRGRRRQADSPSGHSPQQVDRIATCESPTSLQETTRQDADPPRAPHPAHRQRRGAAWCEGALSPAASLTTISCVIRAVLLSIAYTEQYLSKDKVTAFETSSRPSPRPHAANRRGIVVKTLGGAAARSAAAEMARPANGARIFVRMPTTSIPEQAAKAISVVSMGDGPTSLPPCSGFVSIRTAVVSSATPTISIGVFHVTVTSMVFHPPCASARRAVRIPKAVCDSILRSLAAKAAPTGTGAPLSAGGRIPGAVLASAWKAAPPCELPSQHPPLW